MTKLTELANKHGTDKGTQFNNKHGYTEVYPKYIPEKCDKLLEIGIRFGSSMRMWADYYPDINTIYGLDLCVEITKEMMMQIQSENDKFKFFIGDQSNRKHLKEILKNIGENQLDIIIDDGCHFVDCQQISLATLFQALKPGGIYIIEDITNKFYSPEQAQTLCDWRGKPFNDGGLNIKDYINFTDLTINVLDNFNINKKISTPHLTNEESLYLESIIDKVFFYNQGESGAAFVYKK